LHERNLRVTHPEPAVEAHPGFVRLDLQGYDSSHAPSYQVRWRAIQNAF
jgi:hypothetical protein